jgi:hypothetical protein
VVAALAALALVAAACSDDGDDDVSSGDTAPVEDRSGDAASVDPLEAWRVIQHFTVAHLRASLGIDPEPVGLGDGVLDELPDVPVRYEHSP